MGRTIDHVERISESFNALTPEMQYEMVAELFARLPDELKAAALRRNEFHAKMAGLISKELRKRSNGTEASE